MKKIFFVFILFFITNIFANTSIEKYTKLGKFKLNKTSLKEVLNTLGKTNIIKSGDAANSSTRINYFIKKDNYYITFNSSEMGGGDIITSFIIYKNAPKEPFKIIENLNLQLWEKLYIGIEKKEFLKIVKDLKKDKKTYFYEKNKRIKNINKDIDEENLLISFTPKFINNKLVKIEIYKVITY
ncbi:hypothetical protein CRV00_12370 [Malaciobacter molluscorum]|uniref:hypothetical protein n=1 Tax=Malaciobacter molluscorum TaxID=1032072 RepID=UPI00100AAA1E|nr:hypothetical protein [Malaciobacter molluscorum]RXJ92810.1 hypothetical protein CRV00_12370 [Malaciobacter molluscorum]